MYTRFHRLSSDELEQLVAFVLGDGLAVKGLDSGPMRHYRGGFGPIVLLGLAVAVFYFGRHMNLPTFLWLTGPSLVFAWSLRRIWQDFRAVRRSRRLMEDEKSWYALSWTGEQFCYRSWEECVLEPWESITDIRFFPADGQGPLSGSLWLHFGRWQRLLIHDREGRFAGRTMDAWCHDLVAYWTARTGRTPSDGPGYSEGS